MMGTPSYSVENIYRLISIRLIIGDPALEIATLQFRLEPQDVFLEAFLAFKLPGLEIAADILVVELINGKLAEEDFSLRDDLISVCVVD